MCSSQDIDAAVAEFKELNALKNSLTRDADKQDLFSGRAKEPERHSIELGPRKLL